MNTMSLDQEQREFSRELVGRVQAFRGRIEELGSDERVFLLGALSEALRASLVREEGYLNVLAEAGVRPLGTEPAEEEAT